MHRTIPAAAPALVPDLAAIDRDFPGWHAWLSDAGRPNATHVLTPAEIAAARRRSRGLNIGTGITLSADTPGLLRAAIAAHNEDVKRWAA